MVTFDRDHIFLSQKQDKEIKGGYLTSKIQLDRAVNGTPLQIPTLSKFKGDISRFFIFHCKFLLYVGFNVFIKNPDHFPQCSVIK